jgi:hypothetical protein
LSRNLDPLLLPDLYLAILGRFSTPFVFLDRDRLLAVRCGAERVAGRRPEVWVTGNSQRGKVAEETFWSVGRLPNVALWVTTRLSQICRNARKGRGSDRSGLRVADLFAVPKGVDAHRDGIGFPVEADLEVRVLGQLVEKELQNRVRLGFRQADDAAGETWEPRERSETDAEADGATHRG